MPQFEQALQVHKVSECPKCNNSKGEEEINKILTTMNIDFINEHKFEDCKHLSHLKFDFYLPNHNTCIEYDGIQHFKPIDAFGGIEGFESRFY